MNVANVSAFQDTATRTDDTQFLAAVDGRLHRAAAGSRLLEAGARAALFPGGKRARPLLARRFASIAQPPADALLDAAAAIELIHAASLVHDDILDHGELRRGLPTLRVSLGPEAAVLAGDLLLCRALQLLAPYPHEIARAAATFEEICHAATCEWQARRRLDFSLAEWRTMAEGKTGALFGLAGYVAASLAGQLERARRFDAAARALGVAFQIADDFADLVEDGSREDLARALADGNPSFPILIAQSQDRSLVAALASWWADPSRPLAPLLERVTSRAVRATVADAITTQIRQAEAILGSDASAPTLRPLLDWAHGLRRVTDERQGLA